LLAQLQQFGERVITSGATTPAAPLFFLVDVCSELVPLLLGHAQTRGDRSDVADVVLHGAALAILLPVWAAPVPTSACAVYPVFGLTASSLPGTTSDCKKAGRERTHLPPVQQE